MPLTCGYAIRGGIRDGLRPLCVRGCRVPGCERSADRGGTGHGRARTGLRTATDQPTDGGGKGHGRDQWERLLRLPQSNSRPDQPFHDVCRCRRHPCRRVLLSLCVPDTKGRAGSERRIEDPAGTSAIRRAGSVSFVAEDPVAVEAELVRLRAENARLLKLLKLSPQQAAPPVPGQSAFFEAAPGMVHRHSPQEAKVAFFGALFAARTDVYAVRYDNQRTGKSGWIPAVRGGWQKGVRHEDRSYLPLTPAVLAAHLLGQVHIGLYPLLDGDRCWWLAADFDGPEAMFDALMYVKAGRALQVPVALEVSRSGVGAHAWVFFTSPVPAERARRLGTGLLREAMALRGRMSLASYDRLFPSQDLLPVGGIGNLIAAPLFKPARDNGATVFLDL